jgi:hypothetical protein
MRPPKVLSWIALVVMLPQMTGCTSFHPVAPQSVPSTLVAADQERVLRVTTEEGLSVDLQSVWMDSVAVMGFPVDGGWLPDQAQMEILRQDIATIQEARPDGAKTTLLGLGMIGLAAVLYAALVAWAGHDLVTSIERIGR